MSRYHTFNVWILVAIAALVVRFVTLDMYPLADTTEARYGEVARVMATSGNWITPQLEVGTPFWAKPPLSFWQGAASFTLLGTNELAARLPSFLNTLVVLVLLYHLARHMANPRVAALSVVITMTTAVGFVNAGAVMTDPAMLMSTTLAMVSFWWAIERHNTRWGYGFFIALALGLLAKGPVMWVMTGIPLILWLTIERRWSEAFTVLPIVEGTALLGLTAIPWFLMAEIETPGFLHYFFIGEHLQRYLDSGWEGDRYGTAHDEVRGTIWLFALAAFAPWSVIAIIRVISHAFSSGPRKAISQLSSLQRYLLLWCLWPVVFFTFAGNILPAYVLPGLPAFALLLALAFRDNQYNRTLLAFSLLIPLLFSLASPLGLFGKLEERSEAGMIASIKQEYPLDPIAYIGGKPHSARFYSRGNAVFPSNDSELASWLNSTTTGVLIIRNGQPTPSVLGSLRKINKRKRYSAYYYIKTPSTDSSISNYSTN